MERLEKVLTSRAQRRLLPWQDLLWEAEIKHLYFAGGGLLRTVHDIDVCPPPEVASRGTGCIQVLRAVAETKGMQIAADTKNALTITGPPGILQFCHYCHPNLRALVDSFDFAHIQVGADVNISDPTLAAQVEEIYFTAGFLDAHALESTYFVGSAYPLSSLIRIGKFHHRGLLSRGQYIFNVLSVLTAILERGFDGYEDFKDQLDAVDLGLLPSDLSELQGDEGCEMLIKLFGLLDKSEK